MECPQCKNPLSVENASICEWCGNQLPIPEESFFSMFGRWYSILKNYLKINKKRLIIIFSCIILLIVILMNNLHLQHWFTENENVTNSETTNKQQIVPKGLKQTRAFEYLTKVRKELVENPDNFENIAIRYSQDSLLSSCKGIEVDNGQLPPEFDEMASKLEVNQVSEIFEIREKGTLIYYAIMKVLKKGNGFYKAQYITRNIKLEIGQYFQGGIICQLDDNAEHGLIVSKDDFGIVIWTEAKQICEDLDLNGFDNWRLPSTKEIDELYNNKLYLRANWSRWTSIDFDRSTISNGYGGYWSNEEYYFYSFYNREKYHSRHNGGEDRAREIVRAVHAF